MLTNLILLALIQNAVLIHTDIYDNTLGNKRYCLSKNLIFTENNPLADCFFKNDAWDLGYVLAIAGNYGLSQLFLSIDDSGLLSRVTLDIISIASMYAVATSSNPRNVNYKMYAQLIEIQF